MKLGMMVIVAAVCGGVAGAGGVWLLGQPQASAGGLADKAAIETTLRDYLLANPEILPEAMDRLKTKQAAATIGPQRAALEQPFAGAMLGNPKGNVTLVMFSDYACGYCRSTLPDIDKLLAEDANLRIVYREVPILGSASDAAARVALYAAKQGKFEAMHRALFAQPLSEATIAQAAASLDMDGTALNAAAADPAIMREISKNNELAQLVGLTGTPTLVIGDQILQGAVGYDELKAAVAKARG
jgi:protein-disulfide isomerase